MKEFFDMGGYAAYVWPSYGLTLIVVVLNIFWRDGCSRDREKRHAGAWRCVQGRRGDMTPRQRRMALVFGILGGVAIAGALALSAFRQNVTFFFDPTEVASGKVHDGEHFRLGGMVTQGSVQRAPGSLEVKFVVTDFKHDVPVSYTGVLPDLFREGTGVVAHGKMRGDGTFVADEVLAKHDEKYMPPQVEKSLKRRHGESRADAGAQAQSSTPTSPAGT